MVRRAESYLNKRQRLLLKKEGWSIKKSLQEKLVPVDFKNPLTNILRFFFNLN